jgi:PAS domain S-box-containing protein
MTMPCAWPKVAFNTHDGLLVMDHGGIILKVNASFSRITGFASEEMLGLHIDALRPTYYGDTLKEEVIAAVNRQGYWLGRNNACTGRDTSSRCGSW